MAHELAILYEEGGCLVVWKPAGLLTQAPPGIDSLEMRVKAFLQARDGLAEVYLGMPHRLDRPASGAILLAKDLRTTRKLGSQFEHRKVRKVYWACVEGLVSPESGTWQDYLYKIPGEPRAEVVAAGHPGGRRAVLDYRVLAVGKQGSRLEIELQTGRTHQIRVQAASRGHPLLGDRQYGATMPLGLEQADWRLQPIALHARSLTFRNPATHEVVTVTAPLPEYWPVS